MRAAFACLLLVCASTGSALADDDFRCGNRLVHVGDHESEVVEKCGQPTTAVRRNVARRVRGRTLQMTIDTWTYDLSPGEFIRILTFEDAVLKSIELGPYGSRH